MYAISSPSGVYHLVNEAQDATLCGLAVTPIIINRPTKASTIYLTEVEPTDGKPCDACASVEPKKRPNTPTGESRVGSEDA